MELFVLDVGNHPTSHGVPIPEPRRSHGVSKRTQNRGMIYWFDPAERQK